jgi:hypothetical protein
MAIRCRFVPAEEAAERRFSTRVAIVIPAYNEARHLPELLALVKNKIVRVIDLVIIQKYEDGHPEAMEMQQLAPDLLALFDPRIRMEGT